MSKTKFFAGAVAAALIAGPALADMMIMDPYARSASPVAKSGAAFMVLHNMSDTDDRLIAASTNAAARVELHTHIENDDGVMQMREVEGGFAIAAGEKHMLARGGDHVMLMGLTGPLEQGAEIEVTLTFEQAGDVTVTIPVDNERKAAHGGHGHGGHSHSN
ncbi:MAG: copper chaperone PCu(A)C [Pseudomonadota bacterium]